MPTAPSPSSRTVVKGSAEVGAVELPPTAAGRRNPALATQLHEPADEDSDDGDDQSAPERLHGPQCRAGLRNRVRSEGCAGAPRQERTEGSGGGARWNRTTDLI